MAPASQGTFSLLFQHLKLLQNSLSMDYSNCSSEPSGQHQELMCNHCMLNSKYFLWDLTYKKQPEFRMNFKHYRGERERGERERGEGDRRDEKGEEIDCDKI